MTLDDCKTAITLVLLLAVPLAGCANFESLSPGQPSPGQSGQDMPEPDYDCRTGKTFDWSLGFLPKNGSEGHTTERTYCWVNGNLTNNDTEPFYFYAIRERGTGSWTVTMWDGDDETFFHHPFGPGRNVACNDEGKPGAPGNWTIAFTFENVTGLTQVRVDMGERGDWQCP